ncbi:MAG: type II toxin-antitoxin system HicB family antitoxin [Candidatus Kerfeldbacteria bacterium]|nr:type II toxin-antitoxin system HicB family antitoxin [Candidatus Kerfeldbacteria bacterium]
MEKQLLNYRIIIEPERMGKKLVYNAYCPSLGIADYGNTIEEVLVSLKDGIELAIESLLEEKQELPKDNIQQQFITAIQIAPHRIAVHA